MNDFELTVPNLYIYKRILPINRRRKTWGSTESISTAAILSAAVLIENNSVHLPL